MEDYDKFVQRRVFCLSKNNDSNNLQPSSTTSVIRFYGQPILPPLLTEGKRAEMQQHREEAQNAADLRRMKDAARLAHLQAALPRQQAATLEGLLRESESEETSLSSHDGSGGSVLQNSPFTGANEIFLFSPPPEEREKDESHLCATEYEHQPVPPECNDAKDRRFDRHRDCSDNPGLSEALSTNQAPAADLHTRQKSTENKLEPNVDLGGVEQSLRPFTEKSDAFLVPVTKSLLEPSPSGSKENQGASAPPLAVTTHSAFYAAPEPEHQKSCLINQHTGQQVSPTNSLQSPIHDLEKTSVSGGSAAGKDPPMFGSPGGASDVGSVFQPSPSNTIAKMPKIICYPPLDGDELERSGLESWFGCGFVISKGVSHPLGVPDPSADGEYDHLYSTASKVYPSLPPVINYSKDHNPELLQPLPTSQGPQSDRAKPQCINLQALLKRSQEYRRHQQMLRSKVKAREVQETSPEPTRAKTDEQSLPDEKKHEVLHKRAETTNDGKAHEKKSTFIPAEETKHSWEKFKTAESPFLCKVTSAKSENRHAQGDGGDTEISKVQGETSVSHEVTVKPKQSSSSPQQHRRGSRKYRMTRAATFSQSPVCWKDESTRGGRQHDESALRTDGNGFNRQQQVSEATFDRQAGSTPTLCTEGHVAAGEITNPPFTSSQHIDIIESSLCGLKAQILDLESTLKINLDDRSPAESDVLPDKHVQAFQRDCAYLGDGANYSVTNTAAACLRRQLLKETSSPEENSGPEPSDGQDDPLSFRRKGPRVVKSGEHRLAKILNTEEAMLNVAYEEPPTGKGVPHEAQQDQIPEVFHNISPETQVSSNCLVVRSSHQPEEEKEVTVGCVQPSELWFLQGSGSELASEGHPSLQNHLTPERGDEFHGRFWRIKRRLLTHTGNEADRNSSDDGRRHGSALRLTPSGKTWTFTGQGCHKQSAADWPEGDGSGDEQERQKQVHTVGVRSLLEEPSRQQEELLQPGFTPPERVRTLLVAAVKGFLTRRLFKTQRVKKLVDVIRDMQQLLNTLQQPNSLQKEIVTLKALLHLNAARSEISEIFFGVSAGARMQIISQDRELRQKSVQTGRPRRKSCLSAATQKSLERKRERLLAAIRSKVAAQGHLKANCASSPKAVL